MNVQSVIGPVPEHWEIRPFFATGKAVQSKNKGMRESNLLSLSYGRIVEKDIDSSDGLLPESFETYQIVQPKDMIFRFTDLQNDQRSLRSALVRDRGIITSAYLAFRPNDQVMVPKFLDYLMRAYDLSKVFYPLGGGVRQSLKFDDVKRLGIIVPPLAEQKAIADFLDRESLRMNELQSMLLKLTESLNERRLSFITAEFERLMSTSCQEIPLKRCLEFPLKYGANESGEAELIDGIRYLRISDFGKKGVLRTENPQYLELQIAKSYLVETGDLLLARSGATVGKAYLVPPEGSGSCFAGYLIQARPQREKLIPEYLSYFLESYQFESWRQTNFTQSTIQNISAQKYGEMQIPCPTINDQTCLVGKLSEELMTIDSAMELLSNAVVSIQERLQSLISSAVTGKIDVRKVT
jgi:type I restriction enzyme S subunit